MHTPMQPAFGRKGRRRLWSAGGSNMGIEHITYLCYSLFHAQPEHGLYCQNCVQQQHMKFTFQLWNLTSVPNQKIPELCKQEQILEPQTTINKRLFQLDDSKSLHRKWLFHQRSTLNWLFGVPGLDNIFKQHQPTTIGSCFTSTAKRYV